MKSLRLVSNFFLASLIILFSGCLDSPEVYDPYAQLDQDIKTIDAYLTSNAIVALKDLRGVRIDIDELGTGLPATSSNKVKVVYTGRVLGSTTPFESGTATGAMVKNYIAGWQIALTTLPVGSKATVYIPSPLAYGEREQAKIPKNSILQFDMDFQDIEETETERQRLKSDTVAIDTYIEQKNITNVIKDSTGIRYVITAVGAGPKPTWYSTAKMKLVFKLITDDTKIVSTQDLEPTTLYGSRIVDQINGLKVGLQQLPEGSKATFYIPSGLGFGTDVISDGSGATLIPANSNLIVEAELIDIVTL